LVAAAEAFEVDVVVVLDHERLYNELQRDLPSFVRIVHQPKSGGVEDRTREQRIKARRTRIRQVSRQLVWCMSVRSQYFYGTTSQPYFPHSFYVGFDDVLIVKMGADELPASCMPLGMKTTEHRTQIVRVQPDAALRHHLLAVTLADQPDEQVLRQNVVGFVCVSEVCVYVRCLCARCTGEHGNSSTGSAQSATASVARPTACVQRS
jgi:polyribonucleotide 5'-hydroxyl-kinase